MTAIKTGVRMAAYSERGLDYYPTPRIAVRCLMRAVRLPHTLWEPCCGNGSIAQVLRAAGHTVIAQDIADYGCPDSRSGIDFLMETAAPPGCDTIVSNPPYMYAAKFISKALELVPRVIMLCRLAFIEAQRRSHLLDEGLLAGYYPFKNRLPMMHRHDFQGEKNENSAIGYAWFEWRHNRRGPVRIRRLGFSKCKVCKEPFVAREGAKTCSDKCRQQQHRKQIRKRTRRRTIKRVTDSGRERGLSVTETR